jgi:hypothetical protein
MSDHTLRLVLHVPRSLQQAVGTPEGIKDFLVHAGLWPMGAVQRRWTIDPVTQGYELELELRVEVADGVVMGADT